MHIDDAEILGSLAGIVAVGFGVYEFRHRVLGSMQGSLALSAAAWAASIGVAVTPFLRNENRWRTPLGLGEKYGSEFGIYLNNEIEDRLSYRAYECAASTSADVRE